MLNKFRASAMAGVLCLTCASAAFASGGPFKVGYMDLDKLKRDYPDAARAETTKMQAESQLRQIIDKANDELAKASAAKKEQGELEKIKHDLQLQVNGMQEAFRMMVVNQTAEANAKIVGATNEVAKEKGLDMVVDVHTVFAGGDKLIGCEDVTDLVLKKLNAKSAPAAAATPPPTK